jgi:hypothetical protein
MRRGFFDRGLLAVPMGARPDPLLVASKMSKEKGREGVACQAAVIRYGTSQARLQVWL